jgi:hypothetical protein
MPIYNSNIIVSPFSATFLKNIIFDTNYQVDNRAVPYRYLYDILSNRGYTINTVDIGCANLMNYDNTIYLSFNYNKKEFKRYGENVKFDNRILVAQEPLSKGNFKKNNFSKFAKIITWRSDLLKDNKNFIKNTAYPIVNINIDWLPLKERKILVNISINKKSKIKGELYSERIETIKLAEKIFGPQFELYGIGWNKPIRVIDKIMSYKPPISYKGRLGEKYPKLREFKFALCYESNKLLPGNISEKIFDCFQCGVIPLYWGAPDILDFIPEETFIWRERFKTNEEMLLYINDLPEKEIELKLKAIKSFLNSKDMEPFWYKNHIQVIIDIILNFSENY